MDIVCRLGVSGRADVPSIGNGLRGQRRPSSLQDGQVPPRSRCVAVERDARIEGPSRRVGRETGRHDQIRPRAQQELAQVHRRDSYHGHGHAGVFVSNTYLPGLPPPEKERENTC